ncbi:serine hydrolase [Myxococcota bacterium]|nr:serine hydrolase [Myxococcota bacterium]MBU1497542.1 serine hydrolase [Myxococcota bacterium]
MKHLIFFLISSFLLISAPQARRPRKERPVAKAWIAITLDGTVLSERNADDVRSIASLSKLVATLVVVEEGLKLDAVTTMIESDWKIAAGGSRTRLKRGKSYTNRDLLHAALLGSDNRAIPALGRAVGLNALSMVVKMNVRVRKMGLKKTLFLDPTGINYGNISTAREFVRILKEVMKNKILASVMKKETYTVKRKGLRSIIYNNTNILTRYGKYNVQAGKTGFNYSAGYCLATIVKEKNLPPVAYVVLGSSGLLKRFGDFYLIRRSARSTASKMQIMDKTLHKSKKYHVKTMSKGKSLQYTGKISTRRKTPKKNSLSRKTAKRTAPRHHKTRSNSVSSKNRH